jgi:hypothetical protein
VIRKREAHQGREGNGRDKKKSGEKEKRPEENRREYKRRRTEKRRKREKTNGSSLLIVSSVEFNFDKWAAASAAKEGVTLDPASIGKHPISALFRPLLCEVVRGTCPMFSSSLTFV